MSDISIPVEMTPAVVYLVVAFLISWGLEKFPKVKDWWAATQYKWQFLLGLFVAVPVVASLVMAATGVVALSWDPLLWDAIVAGITAFGAGTMLNARALPSKAERDAFNVFLAMYGDHDE